MRGSSILLLTGFTGWTLNYIYRMMLPPLLPIIVRELGLSGLEAGMLMSSFFITYALMQIPAGILSDKISRKQLISVCIFLSSLMTLMSGLVQSYGHLLLARALFGISASLFYAPMISMLSDAYKPESRGKAIGFFMSGSRLGSAIAPITAIFLANLLSWRLTFIVHAFPGFILALIFYLLSYEPKKSSSFSIDNLIKLKIYWKPLLIAYILPLVSLMASMSLQTFLPLYFVENRGISINYVALIVSGVSVAGFLGQIFGGFLTDRIGYKYASIISMILASISILILHFSPSNIILISAIIFGLISAAGAAPIITYTVEFSPIEVRGLSLGIGNTTGFIGASIGSAVGGLLIDIYGYDFFMLFNVAIFIIATIISLLMPIKKQC
ncbi:MAG: hypothetical protein DRJ21_00405 [Candidatus Methanomethylicota archaeon]|uniref:Major facilitator superfamily (MFS) profile domain-containing protein n=1 Tax=Thermoproteota archaeon TaxID=2056631 RepID=A0A497EWC0_9CREN|nr:MAG: hypothetical protein DRJ21_00405 [Candidatus Verstraetearchaeota archaeon]